jgi:putative ABC transport system permease protein
MIVPPRLIPLVLKYAVRYHTRTALTVVGTALAMFLFCAVQAMQAGAAQATAAAAGDTTLVVYRQNRFCPSTSRLPEHYGDRIRAVPGVASVLPMKIAVNNCRTSLDVITFRGVPPDLFAKEHANALKVIDGSIQQWLARSDAALLGDLLAHRRGFRVGDRFEAAGVTVYVAGIIASDHPQDRNVAYVHLSFLQQSTGSRRLGEVTQFNVRVADPSQLNAVARAIDQEFARDADPTHTSPEKAFVARAAADVIELVGFTRWLAWGCLAAVLALVGNSIVLSVQDRIRDHAIFQTLGYSSALIAKLIVAEGLLLGLAGGALGTLCAGAVLAWGRFSLSAEGFSIHLTPALSLTLWGLAIAAALGAAAALVPAMQASRRQIAACFRAV